MTARISQLPVEVANSGNATNIGPPARVAQQSMEVQSTHLPPVRLSQQSVEVMNTLAPPVRLAQQVVEVLSSSVDSLFDKSFGFWATAPNRAITERWQWATDIQQARSGAQVRVSLRRNPLVQIEFDILTTDAAETTLVDALINGWQGRSYYLPIWQDRVKLGMTLDGSETAIPVNLELFGYTDGGFMGLWNSATDFQVVQILQADEENGEIILPAALGRTWGPDAWIAPVRRAWLQPEASAARFTGDAMEARLVFESRDLSPVTALEWGQGSGGPWEIDGLALFAHTPNWIQAPRITYRRRMETLGDETVPKWRQDIAGHGFVTRQEQHTMTTRAEINSILKWVAERRGRARAFLAPVRDRAIRITRSNAIDAEQIYVEARDYTALLAEISPRAYLALRDSAGWVVRKITGVEKFGDEEALTLSSTIRAGSPSSWIEAYLCEPAILASDTVEVRWWDENTADVVISHEQVTL